MPTCVKRTVKCSFVTRCFRKTEARKARLRNAHPWCEKGDKRTKTAQRRGNGFYLQKYRFARWLPRVARKVDGLCPDLRPPMVQSRVSRAVNRGSMSVHEATLSFGALLKVFETRGPTGWHLTSTESVRTFLRLLRDPSCPGGGTGRRAGFRYQWSNSWRFESSPGHHPKAGCKSSNQAPESRIPHSKTHRAASPRDSRYLCGLRH